MPLALSREAVKVLPFNNILNRLRIAPPSLRYILNRISDTSDAAQFIQLVWEYLPENETDFDLLDGYDKVLKFIELFSRKYFPIRDNLEQWLDVDAVECMSVLLSCIPIDYQGFSLEDDHDLAYYQPEVQLLISFIDFDDEGARVSILETMAEMVGADIVRNMPAKGWEPEELHKMLDGSKFAGLADFADWFTGNTGTWILDANAVDGYEPAYWDRDNVDALTEQWPRAKRIRDSAEKLGSWLMQDKTEHYRQLLEYCLAQAKKLAKPRRSKKARTLINLLEGEDEEE